MWQRQVYVVRPDGSDRRLVSQSGRTYFFRYNVAYPPNSCGGLDWSPDGQWLVAQAFNNIDGGDTFDVIRVSDGLTVPLPYTRRFIVFPAWQP